MGDEPGRERTFGFVGMKEEKKKHIRSGRGRVKKIYQEGDEERREEVRRKRIKIESRGKRKSKKI